MDKIKIKETSKTTNFNISASFAFSAVKYFVIFGKYQMSNYTLFEKTNPIFPCFQPQNTILPKTNPIQSQFLSACGGQSQIYTFLCKTNPNFPVFSPKTAISPKNEPKTNPNKANGFDAKMNLYSVLTRHYEKIRLFARNENEPKTNLKQTQFLSAAGGFGVN